MNLTELEQNRGRRLIFLEAIRGLAALVVVFGHLGLTFFPPLHLPSDWPQIVRSTLGVPFSLALNGIFAVRIFFVLSGFVLSLAYFRKQDAQVAIQAGARRYPRLMLPAFASVMFAWVLLKLGWFWNAEAAGLVQQPPYDWLTQWFRIDRGFFDAMREGLYGTFFAFDDKHTLNSSLWTMPWELAGSFVVFSFLALFGSRWWRIILYPLLAVGFYLLRLPLFVDFLAGLVLCDFFVRHERGHYEESRSAIWCALALISGCILGGLLGGWPTVRGGYSEFFVSSWPTVPAVLIIGGISFSSSLQHALEGRLMSILGKISFPLYLFHLSIICSAGCGLYVWLRHLEISHVPSAVIAATSCLALVLALSWGLYFALELPTLRFARRFGQLLTGRWNR